MATLGVTKVVQKFISGESEEQVLIQMSLEDALHYSGDLKEHFKERVAILMHDGGLPQEEAELEAGRIVVTLDRNKGFLWSSVRSALADRPALYGGATCGAAGRGAPPRYSSAYAEDVYPGSKAVDTVIEAYSSWLRDGIEAQKAHVRELERVMAIVRPAMDEDPSLTIGKDWARLSVGVGEGDAVTWVSASVFEEKA